MSSHDLYMGVKRSIPAGSNVDRIIPNADIGVDRIVLDVVKGGIPDTDATALIKDLRIKDSMSTAPTMTLIVHDPDRQLTNSNRLWYEDSKGDRRIRPIDVELEKDLFYRMVQVKTAPAASGRGVDVTMIFEHRIIAYMRTHNRPRKVSRARMTRAQFILMLLKEIKAERIVFRCPELNKRQPIEGADKEERKKLSKREREREEIGEIRNRLGDLGDEPDVKITVKGRAATSRQKRILELAVTIGDDLNAPGRAVIACVAALTTETRATNLAGGDGSSAGPLQVTEETARNFRLKQRDSEAVIKHFYSTGYFGKGGAIDLARKNPHMPIHMIAQSVQGSKFSDGSNYREWVEEAKKTVAAFSGSGAESTSGSSSRHYYKQEVFTRGVDGKKENTYQCADRLAKVVNWRFFVIGKRTVVFMSEPQLFKRPPRMTITPDHPAVISGSGDADVNKKTRTFRCDVRMKRWQAPPGSTVIVEGWGVHDGRYLVDEVDRSVYSPQASVTLKRPENPKKEPRPELVSRNDTGGGGVGLDLEALEGSLGATGSGAAAQLYRYATNISNLGLDYSYGGGHGIQLDELLNTNRGGPTGRGGLTGLDCSSSTSLALFRAELWSSRRGPQGLPGRSGIGNVALVSSGFVNWGAPGRGKHFTIWYNVDHVWIEFHDMGRFKRFDTSPWGSGGRGPRMRLTDRPHDGFKARHWPGL